MILVGTQVHLIYIAPACNDEGIFYFECHQIFPPS